VLAGSIDKSGSFAPVAVRILPETDSEAGAAKQPAESAGKNRLNVHGPRIKLTAIMRVGEPVAMLAVDDQPGRAFGEGDLLAPLTRLISIGDGSVTVRIHGIEHQIATGETFGASEEQTK